LKGECEERKEGKIKSIQEGNFERKSG